MTTDKKPWFLVMRPEDANRPGSQWVRAGAASRGKVVALPIAAEGWYVLFGFVIVLAGSLVAVWTALFAPGRVSLISAIALTIAVIAVLVTALVMVIRSRTTRLPPQV